MKLIKYILIFTLFILSLIYVNKITNMIKNKDEIMIKIKSEPNIEGIPLSITNDEIIPGISGCTIDIDKSYNNMKKYNTYNKDLLIYNELKNNISIDNIYNKYITSGNTNYRNVSIIIHITDYININTNQKLNIFIDGNILNNKFKIKNNYKIYNAGINNKYDTISLEWMNDYINKYNDSSYCINLNKNKTNLDICAKYNMHTIKPLIINNLNTKYNITNGSIIYLNNNTITYLDNIINYLISKDYNIVYLDELLNENKC